MTLGIIMTFGRVTFGITFGIMTLAVIMAIGIRKLVMYNDTWHHNDIWKSDIRYNDTWHTDTWHNDIFLMTIDIITLS
jgi:hypothetical protein